jgi:cyclopropane fatty-acyl-phospholipid synthase-like methyltransferase
MRKYSEACEQNKDPILSVFRPLLKDNNNVLEIGSGTGQHAVYFSRHLPHVTWQPSDLVENLSSIQAWIEEEQLSNIKPPIELDARSHPWPIKVADVIFSANTLHIMSWEMVEHFFKGVGEVLSDRGILFIYGPFSYQGKHTSQSNENFDRYLKQCDPSSGIRDFVEVDSLAEVQDLELIEDYAMPVNNRSLVWQKR